MTSIHANLYDDMAAYYDQLMLGGYYDYKSQAATLREILPTGASVLEIGVGTGLMAAELARLGFNVTGMDHTQEMLDRARELLGPELPLHCADVTDFDLGRQFDVILSNGGVWYGVWNGNELGYCGHMPERNRIEASVECTARHLGPGGKLALSMQDVHRNRTMDLPEGVVYEQRIHDQGEGVFEKEYIFRRGAGNETLCYQKLTLAYIEKDFFEGLLGKHGLAGPTVSDDKRYLIFERASA